MDLSRSKKSGKIYRAEMLSAAAVQPKHSCKNFSKDLSIDSVHKYLDVPNGVCGTPGGKVRLNVWLSVVYLCCRDASAA